MCGSRNFESASQRRFWPKIRTRSSVRYIGYAVSLRSSCILTAPCNKGCPWVDGWSVIMICYNVNWCTNLMKPQGCDDFSAFCLSAYQKIILNRVRVCRFSSTKDLLSVRRSKSFADLRLQADDSTVRTSVASAASWPRPRLLPAACRLGRLA